MGRLLRRGWFRLLHWRFGLLRCWFGLAAVGTHCGSRRKNMDGLVNDVDGSQMVFKIFDLSAGSGLGKFLMME